MARSDRTKLIRLWGRAVVATLALVAVVGGLGTAVEARQKRPLPPFEVMTLEGAPAPSAQLGPTGQWLLIYVTPASAASGRLLSAMKSWESPAMTERVVVIVAGAVDEVAAFVAGRAEQFAAVRWFADPSEAAWHALRFTGTPSLVGVRDGQIQWTLAGVLNDPKALESVVRSWIER